MGNSDCGIGFIHVLPAGTAGPKRVNAQIPLIQIHFINFFQFRHDGHRTGRRMNPSLCFRLRNPLHPVGTRFEFELLIDVLAFNAGNNFLEAAMLPRALIDYL